MKTFEKIKDVDFSYEVPGLGRFRVNAHRQRQTVGISMRAIKEEIPPFESLNLPEVIQRLTYLPRGLILRDLGLLYLNETYHLANLYDLVVVAQLRMPPWLRQAIELGLSPPTLETMVQCDLARATCVTRFLPATLHMASQIDPSLVQPAHRRIARAAVEAGASAAVHALTLDAPDASLCQH